MDICIQKQETRLLPFTKYKSQVKVEQDAYLRLETMKPSKKYRIKSSENYHHSGLLAEDSKTQEAGGKNQANEIMTYSEASA